MHRILRCGRVAFVALLALILNARPIPDPISPHQPRYTLAPKPTRRMPCQLPMSDFRDVRAEFQKREYGGRRL